MNNLPLCLCFRFPFLLQTFPHYARTSVRQILTITFSLFESFTHSNWHVARGSKAGPQSHPYSIRIAFAFPTFTRTFLVALSQPPSHHTWPVFSAFLFLYFLTGITKAFTWTAARCFIFTGWCSPLPSSSKKNGTRLVCARVTNCSTLQISYWRKWNPLSTSWIDFNLQPMGFCVSHSYPIGFPLRWTVSTWPRNKFTHKQSSFSSPICPIRVTDWFIKKSPRSNLSPKQNQKAMLNIFLSYQIFNPPHPACCPPFVLHVYTRCNGSRRN